MKLVHQEVFRVNGSSTILSLKAFSGGRGVAIKYEPKTEGFISFINKTFFTGRYKSVKKRALQSVREAS